jgi:hypothetical protein
MNKIVHNKVQNKLDSKRAQDLVYIYINARLFNVSLKEKVRIEIFNTDQRHAFFVPLGSEEDFSRSKGLM